MPDWEIPDNIDEVKKDEDLLEKIHEKCLDWQKQIQNALELLQQRKQQGNGPLAEIDYWRERNAALSALAEQLKIPKVSRNTLVTLLVCMILYKPASVFFSIHFFIDYSLDTSQTNLVLVL